MGKMSRFTLARNGRACAPAMQDPKKARIPGMVTRLAKNVAPARLITTVKQ
jgi:hypothetical protein